MPVNPSRLNIDDEHASHASAIPAPDSLHALTHLYATMALNQRSSTPPRVAVVGAGLAGLTAAWLLGEAGIPAHVFDAAALVGGRVRSDVGSFAPGFVTELGGEFIDTGHMDMRALAAHFGLPLIDTQAASEEALTASYFLGGRHYSETEVVAAFGEYAPRIAEDARVADSLRDVSLAEYLDRLRVTGWLRTLLDVAYVTEFGCEAHEQPCTSFLDMIATDSSQGFAIFGSSDQRFKIEGGNVQLAQCLAHPLGERLRLGHRLVRVEPRGAALGLHFSRDAAATVEISADIVVLALPFSLLKHVELAGVLPAHRVSAIRDLGYGSNAKIMVGLARRLWRAQGRDGDLYSDLPGQTGWDASRLREGEAGVYTFYLGGQPGLACGADSAAQQALRMTAPMEAVFPGFGAPLSGKVLRAHWPGEPFSMGSYACSRVGQASTTGSAATGPVGRIYFAGEHCSDEFQGYMNGAAETGRKAALAILRSLA